MDSILTSVKKALGLAREYTEFDADIIMHINSTFSVLTQLGVGPAEGFRIEDEDAEWNSYLEDRAELNMVKSYMYVKVRLLFDPQSLTGALLESYKETAREYEWRLNVAADKSSITEERRRTSKWRETN